MGVVLTPQTWRDGMTAAITVKARSHFLLLCKNSKLVSAYLDYSADQVLKYEMPYYICIASF